MLRLATVADSREITQDDVWAVITSYFEAKGLVRQQLDSFDEFVKNTIAELVQGADEIILLPENQHVPGAKREMEVRRVTVCRHPRRGVCDLVLARCPDVVFVPSLFQSPRPPPGRRIGVRCGVTE